MRNEKREPAHFWQARSCGFGWIAIACSTVACTYDYSQFNVVDEPAETATGTTEDELTSGGDAGATQMADVGSGDE